MEAHFGIYAYIIIMEKLLEASDSIMGTYPSSIDTKITLKVCFFRPPLTYHKANKIYCF